MTRNMRTLLWLTICLLTITMNAFAQDICAPCTKLTDRGVFSRDMSRASSNTLNLLFYELTHVEFSEAQEVVKKATSAGLGGKFITDAGLPVGVDGTFNNSFDENKFKQWQVEHREKYQSLLSQITLTDRESVHGDEVIVKGVVDCLKACTAATTNVHLSVTSKDKNIVTIRIFYFPPPGSALNAEIRENFTLPRGVVVEGTNGNRLLFRMGEVLNVGTNTFSLDRARRKTAFGVNVKTTRGDDAVTVPAFEEPVLQEDSLLLPLKGSPFNCAGSGNTDDQGFKNPNCTWLQTVLAPKGTASKFEISLRLTVDMISTGGNCTDPHRAARVFLKLGEQDTSSYLQETVSQVALDYSLTAQIATSGKPFPVKVFINPRGCTDVTLRIGEFRFKEVRQ